MDRLGHNKVMLKGDNEPAILALRKAVGRETSVETVMEESFVGDHQANGVAENAVNNAQGQFRVLKDAMESRINRQVEGDHQAVPWMVTCAATVIDEGRMEDEGFAAYRRWKGTEFTRPVADFGEHVMHLPAPSSGKNKLDVRWEDGVWLGMTDGERRVDHRNGEWSCEGQ